MILRSQAKVSAEEQERLVDAARRVRFDVADRHASLLDHFLRYDPGSNGTVSRKHFADLLRVLGVAGVDRELLCRRFGVGHWQCDYLDFCRFVELSEASSLETLVGRIADGLSFEAYRALRQPLREVDPRRTGYVAVRVFRSIVLRGWHADLNELHLQLLASRFANPRDPALVAYEPLADMVEAAAARRHRDRYDPPRWRECLDDDDDDDESVPLWRGDDRRREGNARVFKDHTSSKRYKPRSLAASQPKTDGDDDLDDYTLDYSRRSDRRRGFRWTCAICCYSDNRRASCLVCGALNPNSDDAELVLECLNCHAINPRTARKCDACKIALYCAPPPSPRRGLRVVDDGDCVDHRSGAKCSDDDDDDDSESDDDRAKGDRNRRRFTTYSPKGDNHHHHHHRIRELDFDD